MKRDTVKTFAGLVVIAGIVVATFAYGNAQRQNQLKHDQDVKNQQAKATTLPSASNTPKSSTSTAPSSSASANTAPVKSPTANSIQGSQQQSGSTSGQVANAQSNIPQTGGTGASAPLPDTGAPVGGVLGVTAVIGSALALRRSKRALFAAARR
ncbi:MAG TPA: hypothetical protein VGH44_02480 [Candidatus Saccharimonadia bacterium]|jgi:cytoskeletal protein RodZ